MFSAPEKQVVTVTEIIAPKIAVVQRPKPVQLNKMKWYVVTEENLEQFIQEFKDKNGELVFIAISIKDYENLSLNTAELRRYINQQNEVIIYYEESIAKAEENVAEAAQGGSETQTK
jgi:GTPase involved in cell partitioning and DNA repair